MACGEFELIERYFSNRQAQRFDVVKSIGDDCALLEPIPEQLVAVSTDTLVCGVHFFADMPAHALGYKALVANLSDLAAMGASPSWVSLALTLPEIDEPWLAAFSEGFFKAADYYGIELIGGDITRGPLSITLTVQGQVPKGQQITRDKARIGDWVCVTGQLGDAALALESLYQRTELPSETLEPVLKRLYYPTPRLLAGQALRNIASSAIDLSDGLASDLKHIAKQSGCKAIVDVGSLPLSAQLRDHVTSEQALKLALSGGEDYELCFTVSPQMLGSVETALKHTNTTFTCIGQMQTGEGIEFRLDNKPISDTFRGFVHF
ncbi:thiamine-phosphate kinase [Psychrobium sp. 1_MG-2023]|uniref:thiamine-phosphate kinase n=1 Tax=Psychrobium sp. 1_MG-2023 TaxID=3062624 RepID=UPI000C32C2BF|nr:thiamine-phosphate kinase [Psychrobium sp. 1_MG-2023]MDP2561822.1 thiamine-phosphate kinase [Psychrobium sp. 1_MG-2023]PKF55805.1 thiamine-phosphate kinase [Alteromonadales bacterium alter-6D02]